MRNVLLLKKYPEFTKIVSLVGFARSRMSDQKKAWGRRLKQARLAAGLSQKQLGIEAGIDASVASSRVNKYETGLNQVDLATARKLADVLRVPVSFFYEDDDELAGLLFRYYSIGQTKRSEFISSLTAIPGPPAVEDL